MNETRRTQHVFAILTACVLALNAPATAVDLAAVKRTPANTSDLRDIEAAVKDVVKRAMPCTVGVRVGLSRGSGVIISEDGYVLTAAHVIGQPNLPAIIEFPDGREVPARTLGMHTSVDGALVKISEEGKWPHATLVGFDNFPETGDWCVCLGHPQGLQQKRAAPVRVGRIIDVRDDVIRSDCPLTGGDSGGPLFDIHGRVIGINSRISNDVTENLHGPALACREVWGRLKKAEIYPPPAPSKFVERFDINRDGSVSRTELPEGTYQRVFDELVKRHDLDPKKTYSLRELEKAINWRGADAIVFGRPYNAPDRRAQSIKSARYVRGRDTKRAFVAAIKGATAATVRVESKGKRVALGAVVDSSGLILTKSSELKGALKVELSDGRRFSAERVGYHRDYDLALLRIPADGLSAVEWTLADALPVGSWTVTTSGKARPAAVGVVSVASREIEGVRGAMGIVLDRSVREARVQSVAKKSGAEAAGLKANDVITHILGTATPTQDALLEKMATRRAGDVIEATVLRAQKSFKVKITLGSLQDIFFPQFNRFHFGGRLSSRRDDFSSVIQHDSVIDPTLCGGPLVDLNGKVVAINIARADRVATYAVPASEIRPIVKKLLESVAKPSNPKTDKAEDTE